MPRLVHLHLFNHTVDHTPPKPCYQGYQMVAGQQVCPCRNSTPLSSIKVLTLALYTESHHDYHSPHWASAFPEVQVIEVANFEHRDGCSACGIEPGSGDDQAKSNCFRQMVQTFRMMPKLKFIYEKHTEHEPAIQWTVEQLFGTEETSPVNQDATMSDG